MNQLRKWKKNNMNSKETRRKLKIGDILIDEDGEDRKGYGEGIVKSFYTGWILVHFENRKLPMLVSDGLFCYNRFGLNSIRCKTPKEIKEIKKMMEENIKEKERLEKKETEK